MPDPILQTKIFIPGTRHDLVSRQRLFTKLNTAKDSKLTLISAPAGFGKTTLASEWVAVSDRPAAWVALDEGDNDPIRFLSYIIAALQTISANFGEEVLRTLQSPQPP
ncbi:MAG: LuxR family transcriptional regulator, partial [Gammaproteobacteria bacterium]